MDGNKDLGYALDFLNKYEQEKPILKALVDPQSWYSSAQGAMTICNVMVEFAQMHVQAALKEAGEKVTANFNAEVDKNSILNAYPLTNIK